jgi:hypothetical protein
LQEGQAVETEYDENGSNGRVEVRKNLGLEGTVIAFLHKETRS